MTRSVLWALLAAAFLGIILTVLPRSSGPGVNLGWPSRSFELQYGWASLRTDDAKWSATELGYRLDSNWWGYLGQISLRAVLDDWAVAVAIVLVFFIPVEARRRRILRQRAFPQCRSCGYNLTGNDSGVCPECGAIAQIRDGRAG